MTGAVPGIIRLAQELPLHHLRAFLAQRGGDAVFGQVEIDLVGGGGGAGILQHDIIGVFRIAIFILPYHILDGTLPGGNHIEHGAIGEIKRVKAGGRAGFIGVHMPDAACKAHCFTFLPGQAVAGEDGGVFL